MAKWGEGDPRWIVEERPDATNCNNWHWVEKNATPWSRERLAELLIQQSLQNGPIKVDFKEFKKLEGDATANNRKAKLIFLFDWIVEIEFIATVAGSDIEYKGHIEIPNFSDENGADEIEISIQIDTRGFHEESIRHLLYEDGLAFIRKQVGIYLRELKEEFGKDLILPTCGSNNTKPQVVVKGKTRLDKKSDTEKTSSDIGSSPQNVVKNDTPILLRKFELIETFKVPPDRLYEILTEPDLVKVWGGAGSIFDARIGGKFSLVGGAFVGSILSLTRDIELSQNFRIKRFPEGHYSKIRFKLLDKGDCTDLMIEVEDVPENCLEETNSGIVRYFMQAIGRTFNIGLKLI